MAKRPPPAGSTRRGRSCPTASTRSASSRRPTQGSLSPFGDVEFPLDEVPYVHPVTEINR